MLKVLTKKYIFYSPIPRDPFVAADIPAKETLQLRCYESSAANPRNGKDVFNVISQAHGKGLNGIDYKHW